MVPEQDRKTDLEVVEVEVDGYDVAMIVDALDVWQVDGLPTNNPMLDQNPRTKKQVEELRWRLYGSSS
jgi:hypothetical protein